MQAEFQDAHDPARMSPQSPPSAAAGAEHDLWSVAVFAAREQPQELMATIAAIVESSSPPTTVDVMVNGNPGLAAACCGLVAAAQPFKNGTCVRVWSVQLGGKAHAWNQYLHHVWPGRGLTYFVDGYARICSNALSLLSMGMARDPDCIAATGIPTSGRTAASLREETLKHGGLHGAMFGIKESAMAQLRARKFRLPLGLYGFDTLLGAVLGFGLDPARHDWDAKRFILIVPDVSWVIDRKAWWRPSVLKTQFNRTVNNALRALVVEATKDFLAKRRLPPETLPHTVAEFVLNWVDRHPRAAKALLARRPLCRLVLKRLREDRDWSSAATLPRLDYASQDCS